MEESKRPSTLEDALVTIHVGQWFTWTDPYNKVYANLRLVEKIGIGGELVDNPITTLPTEADINAKLLELQKVYDELNLEYRVKRSDEYPLVAQQLALIYDDIENGKLNKTGSYYKTIKAIKDKYPKS